MSYKELEVIYNQYFSLGNLNININNKFALISLICYITTSMQKKQPDVTYYQVVHKICDKLGFEEDFIKGLAIMCANFGYGCTEFPTFEIKPKDMVETCRSILKTYMPF